MYSEYIVLQMGPYELRKTFVHFRSIKAFLAIARHQICIIRLYGLFGAIVLRNAVAQLGERVPQSLSNDVIKLLRVRVPVIANFYDPTTFVFALNSTKDKNTKIASFLYTSY